MIDIIIPAYNNHKTIEKTLLSISYQTISDKLNVYLVNDKSDNDYHDIVNKYSKYIKIVEIDLDENVGPGLAREEGLKASKSDYFMFIDADDVFASPKSIELIHKTIIDEKADIVIGKFVEVLPNDYIQHYEDQIWLHGKIFKRSFIEKHNIHFNNTRINEDNFFVQCVLLSNPKISYYEYPIYFWDYNPDSITRRNNSEFSYKGISGYINNMYAALDFAINNNCNKSLIANKAYSVLVATYYYYVQYEDKEFLELISKVKKIYKEYKEFVTDKANIDTTQYKMAIESLDEKKINSTELSFDEFMSKVGD